MLFTHQLDEHVTLKLVSPRYVDELFAVSDANRAYLRRYLPWVDKTESASDTADFVKRARREFADQSRLPLSIFWDDHLVGGIGLLHDKPNRTGEMGYWLAADYQGKGLITRSCRAIIQFGFTEWQINRIVIRCATDNARSCAVPERLGFTFEGILRESHWCDDRPQDMKLYSLLARDVMNGES